MSERNKIPFHMLMAVSLGKEETQEAPKGPNNATEKRKESCGIRKECEGGNVMFTCVV